MEMTQKLRRRPEEVDEVASEVAVEGLAWEVQVSSGCKWCSSAKRTQYRQGLSHKVAGRMLG